MWAKKAHQTTQGELWPPQNLLKSPDLIISIILPVVDRSNMPYTNTTRAHVDLKRTANLYQVTSG